MGAYVRLVLPNLYTQWAFICLPIALYISLLLFSNISTLSWTVIILWLQFIAYCIHQFEEHAYPGGFKEFIAQVLHKHTDNSVTIFWINIVCIWLLFPLCIILAQHYKLEIGVVLPIFVLFNASTHIVRGIAKRRYNPGLITSITVLIPLAWYTLWYMQQIHILTKNAIIVSLFFTLAVHAIVMGLLLKK